MVRQLLHASLIPFAALLSFFSRSRRRGIIHSHLQLLYPPLLFSCKKLRREEVSRRCPDNSSYVQLVPAAAAALVSEPDFTDYLLLLLKELEVENLLRR